MRVRQLQPWFDIDELADLKRFRDLLQRGEVVAPNTARVLADLELGDDP